MPGIPNIDDADPAHSLRLRARIVFPGDGPAIEPGTLIIESGRIVDVSPRGDSAAIDLGDAAVIPGLINAHTHLEFSDLPAPIAPPRPFPDWIRNVVAHRRSRTEPTAGIVARGLAESAAAGTTTLGEIATEDSDASDLPDRLGRVVRFRELIGFPACQIEPQLEIARRHLTAPAEDRAVHGISPHAPYSVHPDLFRGLVELAIENDCPIAMHLGETADEIEFLESSTGPFVEFLKQWDLWDAGAVAAGTRPLDYLRELAKAQRALAIHGNQFNESEIQFLGAHPHVSLVYCPRTHAYFRHPPHPWRDVTARGGNVVLGTDSRASNPDLSLWNELQFLREHNPELEDEQLLRYGTVNGARALGLDNETGRLAPGLPADLCVISLADAGGGLFARANRVRGVMAAGRWIHKNV